MKIFKKMLSLVVMVAIMAINTSTVASAVESEDAYFKEYANNLENHINFKENQKTMTENSPVDIIESFIEEYGNKYDASILQSSALKKTIYLDKETSIILDGMMIYINGVEEVEPTFERINRGAIDPTVSLFGTIKTTPIKSYYHAVYAAVLGQELYRITQEAQFTYSGSSVSVNYSDGYYKRGVLSIWQVSNFTDSKVSSITRNGVYYAQVKSSANFHYGLEINGVGLVIQDNYCWVDVRCSKNGSIQGYRDNGNDL